VSEKKKQKKKKKKFEKRKTKQKSIYVREFVSNNYLYLIINYTENSLLDMRQLTEEETKVVFEKLAGYIGRNIASLINRTDGAYCFRIQKDRVYYTR
jgi:hypothetical protein